MKVLSLTEPYAALIKERKKKQKQEVGKHHIEANYIYMQVRHVYQRNGKIIKNL